MLKQNWITNRFLSPTLTVERALGNPNYKILAPNILEVRTKATWSSSTILKIYKKILNTKAPHSNPEPTKIWARSAPFRTPFQHELPPACTVAHLHSLTHSLCIGRSKTSPQASVEHNRKLESKASEQDTDKKTWEWGLFGNSVTERKRERGREWRKSMIPLLAGRSIYCHFSNCGCFRASSASPDAIQWTWSPSGHPA